MWRTFGDQNKSVIETFWNLLNQLKSGRGKIYLLYQEVYFIEEPLSPECTVHHSPSNICIDKMINHHADIVGETSVYSKHLSRVLRRDWSALSNLHLVWN